MSGTPTLDALAADVGALDMFVFHVLSDDRMVNLDGSGRGSGWAGNVWLDPKTESFLASALENGLARMGPSSPTRVFGPYWAEEAVAIRRGGHVIALGGDGIAEVDDARITRVADQAVDAIEQDRPSKDLADKLEIAQAELSVKTIAADDVQSTIEHVARAAARALSCEFGAILMADEPMLFAFADEGWRPAATPDEIATALMPLVGAVDDDVLIEQDLRESPYAVSPVSFREGLVSRCTAPFQFGGHRGLIVVAHSGAAPRGFTDLCQRVATTMAAATPQPLSRCM